jgi:hypothetical protein
MNIQQLIKSMIEKYMFSDSFWKSKEIREYEQISQNKLPSYISALMYVVEENESVINFATVRAYLDDMTMTISSWDEKEVEIINLLEYTDEEARTKFNRMTEYVRKHQSKKTGETRGND